MSTDLAARMADAALATISRAITNGWRGRELQDLHEAACAFWEDRMVREMNQRPPAIRPTWRDWTYRRHREYQEARTSGRRRDGYWSVLDGMMLVGDKRAADALGYFDHRPHHRDILNYGPDWRDLVG